MQNVGGILKQRFEQIIVENEMLRAGFAAMPYLVLRDAHLTLGARRCLRGAAYVRLATGCLLSGPDKDGQRHGRQRTLAAEVPQRAGSQRLHSHQATGPQQAHRYYILDVKTKLEKGKSRGGPEA